jgi:hypothetical protein
MVESQNYPAVILIITYAVVCSCCFICTYRRIFLTMGISFIAAFLTQILGSSVTTFIGFKHALYILILWALSVIILQIEILIECRKINLHVAAVNAVGGAIGASLVLLIWDILIMVLPQLKAIFKIISMIPWIGPMVYASIDAQILGIFNLIFGVAIARNVALAQGCPPEPPAEEPKK